jgi:2-polyprenyl-6-methoxyphenol hydroxylase-like FAD-dependent oxidoreductase
METRTLIVGAGPTGLMLANQLVRHGVPAMIIDHHSGPAQQSRAMAVQARTMEIYEKMGISPQAIELGARAQGGNIWAGGRHKARIPLGQIGKDSSPFPYVLMLGQDDNERILGDRLRELGVEVQWNTELVDLEQKSDRVEVTLRRSDGTEQRIAVAWVAGCDGSRSAVREKCGIGFPGAPYEQVFFVADTVLTGDMVPDELNVYLWKKGFHLFFPMRGENQWRVIGILPENLRNRDDLTLDDVTPHVRQAAGASLAVHACHWFSTYRIHHRRAARFRDRRCFLLGDAAHVHSPMGAQGMNTGLQDAYNLAWKLAMVSKGEADATLLDSYEAERIPVAERLLHTSDRAFRFVVSDTWLAGLFRTRLLARIAAIAMRRERFQSLAFRTISQLGIRYRRSALSRTLPGSAQTGPQAGDRFPWLRLRLRDGGPIEDLFQALDDTRFSLIVTEQTEAAARARQLDDLVRTVVVPAEPANERALARVQISGPRFFLLRPDGHIGLAGTRLDPAAITAYFADARIGRRMSSGAQVPLSAAT